MQGELRKRGVQLLGFNCVDDAELARGFLRRVGVTFPTILDTSARARRICDRDYGVRAYPAHYLISHGWVVDAWMGFESDHRQAAEALGKLGIKVRANPKGGERQAGSP